MTAARPAARRHSSGLSESRMRPQRDRCAVAVLVAVMITASLVGQLRR
jgi:hypothetical protein